MQCTPTRSRTALPGPLAEGNRRADAQAVLLTVPKALEQAKWSHEFFHQSAKLLKRQFQITVDQARSVLMSCPDCQQLAPVPSREGVNPGGITANEVRPVFKSLFADFSVSFSGDEDGIICLTSRGPQDLWTLCRHRGIPGSDHSSSDQLGTRVKPHQWDKALSLSGWVGTLPARDVGDTSALGLRIRVCAFW